MELFVDTSALVKFYYPESGSEDVEAQLLAAERVIVSRLSVVSIRRSAPLKDRDFGRSSPAAFLPRLKP